MTLEYLKYCAKKRPPSQHKSGMVLWYGDGWNFVAFSISPYNQSMSQHSVVFTLRICVFGQNQTKIEWFDWIMAITEVSKNGNHLAMSVISNIRLSKFSNHLEEVCSFEYIYIWQIILREQPTNHIKKWQSIFCYVFL